MNTRLIIDKMRCKFKYPLKYSSACLVESLRLSDGDIASLIILCANCTRLRFENRPIKINKSWSISILFNIMRGNRIIIQPSTQLDSRIRRIYFWEKYVTYVTDSSYLALKQLFGLNISEQVFRRGRPRTIYISLPQFTYKKASIPNLSPSWLFMSNAFDPCHPEF